MLHGAKDRQVPIANVNYLRDRFTKAGRTNLFDQLVFQDYNHFIPWEQPGAVEAAIRMMTDRLSRTALLLAIVGATTAGVIARNRQAQAPKEPDLCAVPPGAQPLLPAKLLPGMGVTKDFPATTTSEEARTFFLQGVSQIHSFWFVESERSCLQALEFDPKKTMAD